jgi:hypothetical protein
MDEGAGERVEEADGASGLVAEDEESINDAEAVVGGELRAVDLGACTSADVDEAAARRGCAVGDRDPVVGAEAGVKPAAGQTGVVGALAPGLARGSETSTVRSRVAISSSSSVGRLAQSLLRAHPHPMPEQYESSISEDELGY